MSKFKMMAGVRELADADLTLIQGGYDPSQYRLLLWGVQGLASGVAHAASSVGHAVSSAASSVGHAVSSAVSSVGHFLGSLF